MMKKLVDKYLDSNAFAVINGGPELGKKLNSQKFDLICFTGSTFVGKIVATEAAKNLVPCILELGGKCPFIVDTSADVEVAAQKCMWAKTLNSGQVCIAPDYVLCHETKVKAFVEACIRRLKDFFPGDKLSPLQGKMVNKFHTARMKRLIETSGGNVVYGGQVNIEERHV
jgi:acyl-CoA reductase-like NAD-dependent aldehyde dehydrogenase